MFRSEEMALCQLFIQQEAAFASVSMLGDANVVEFRDLNADVNPCSRKFFGEVRRCEELERKLRYIADQMRKDNVVIAKPRPQALQSGTLLNPRDIIEIEANIEKTESEMIELSRNAVNLRSSFVELTEMKQVLEKAQVFLTEMEELPTKVFGAEDRGRLSVIAGVIQRGRLAAFETMLWRISRGNVLLRQADLEDLVKDPATLVDAMRPHLTEPLQAQSRDRLAKTLDEFRVLRMIDSHSNAELIDTTGQEVHKTVFVVFFQGENLKSAVRKVCAGFRATTYPCPGTVAERADMVRSLRVRLQDLILILDQTSLHRQRVEAVVRKELHTWSVVVLKTKAIYHTLNKFNVDVTKRCLIGECWTPARDVDAVRHALLQAGTAVGSNIPCFLNVIHATGAVGMPPTYIATNKLTAGFQTLIDAYSVASYREVNPAVYSIVTFPFLFAVMFGDLGHGLLMTLFALAMVLMEDKLAPRVRGSEIMTIFFGGRYVILLMGLFSMYTGLMYNDAFAMSMSPWPSSWRVGDVSRLQHAAHYTLDPERDFGGAPYPLGLDPVWQLAENKIIFLNSFKMKLSIILGVVHMVFGISLSVVNHITRRRSILILLEFVPQLLFLVLLIGYLAALMLFKWYQYGPVQGVASLSSRCAPSVLITFINMMLRKKNEAPPGCSPSMFPGQPVVEQVLLYSALSCVPFLLLAKPLYVLFRRRALARRFPPGGTSEDGSVSEKAPQKVAGSESAEPLVEDAEDGGLAATSLQDDVGEDVDGHGEPFSEIMVHQCIHTVEYVLSTVSHTASYLRLWALSLAHSQLSHVLWSMVLRKGLSAPYQLALPLPLLFAAWAFFTITIMVMMEGLSAFLHTLRLHWVEFMSKFYEGEGYAFQPFSFRAVEDAVDVLGG